MSLPERASGLQAEVIGLETNFKQIQKRAVLTGYVYALDLNETSYQVMRRQAGEWVPAANLTHDFPPAVVADVPDQKMGETGWRFLFYPAGVPDPVRVILIGKNERRDVSHQASRAFER